MRSCNLIALLVLAITSAGCELAGSLIEAGFWMAVIFIIAIILIIGWIWRRRRGRGGPA